MSANATGTSMSMAPSDGGVLHQMWIPCVVFAHMFAGYFLLRMLTVMYPKAWADIKRKLFCRGSLKDQQVHAAKGEYHVAAGLVNIWAKLVECRVGFYNMHQPSECRDQAVHCVYCLQATARYSDMPTLQNRPTIVTVVHRDVKIILCKPCLWFKISLHQVQAAVKRFRCFQTSCCCCQQLVWTHRMRST